MTIKQAFFLTEWDEEEIEGFIQRFPKLGERVRDWIVIAEESGKYVFHVITQDMPKADRLLQRIEYLGKSYKQIAQRAKAGDIPCGKALKRIVFTNWEIDNPDPEGPPRINHRGTLKEWLDAGRPTRLTGWQKAHDWLGNNLDAPHESEVE